MIYITLSASVMLLVCGKKNPLLPRDYLISRNEKPGVERQINSLENWLYANRDKFAIKNRKDEIRDGKKLRTRA